MHLELPLYPPVILLYKFLASYNQADNAFVHIMGGNLSNYPDDV